MGYEASFGQNTFSKDINDKGLSSYLRHRMFDGWQYKGFGVSAQSLSNRGVSYNLGKNTNALTSLIKDSHSFETNCFYDLPKHEILAKFIAISGYSGGFSLKVTKDIYGESFFNEFNIIIAFLLEKKYIRIADSRIELTPKGMINYGPILSLFFP